MRKVFFYENCGTYRKQYEISIMQHYPKHACFHKNIEPIELQNHKLNKNLYKSFGSQQPKIFEDNPPPTQTNHN